MVMIERRRRWRLGLKGIQGGMGLAIEETKVEGSW